MVVSDFRQSALQNASTERKRQIRSLISKSGKASSVFLLPALPLVDGPRNIENVAVHIESESESIVGPNQTSDVVFTVGNFGNQVVTNLVIDIKFAGLTQATVRMDLAAGQIERRTIELPPLPQGDHVIEVVCDRKDEFPYDNRAAWVLQSIAPEQVLLIHGSQTKSYNYLQFAISPPAFNEAGEIQEQTSLPRQFRPLQPVAYDNHAELERLLKLQPKHIVFCDVPRVNDQQLDKIKELTAQGTLLFLAGPSLDATWFQKKHSVFLPAMPVELASERFVPTQNKMQLADVGRLPLNNQLIQSVGDLNQSIEIKKSWKLKLPESIQKPAQDDVSKTDSTGTTYDVFGKTIDGDPLMIVAQAQNQMQILSAFDFQPAETNLQLSGGFVPLIQSFYQSHLQQVHPSRNVVVGGKLPVAVANPVAVTDSANGTADNNDSPQWRYGLILESGRNKTANTEPISLGFGVKPGVYSAIASKSGEASSVRYAAVQIPWAESNLTIASRASVEQFAEELGCQLYQPRSQAAAAASPPVVTDGHEVRWNVWRYFLCMLLIMLLAELFVQHKIARSMS